jgi:hypothetical protein
VKTENNKVLLRLSTFGWRLQLEWKLEDMWFGLFWKNTHERIDIWLCLIPCFPLHYASPVSETEEKQ